MNPLSATSTPIYDALYAQWRAGCLAVPGERGPEDYCPLPDFGYRPPALYAPYPLQPGYYDRVPRQLPWTGRYSPVPRAAFPAPARQF